jgi:hypothetical protein
METKSKKNINPEGHSAHEGKIPFLDSTKNQFSSPLSRSATISSTAMFSIQAITVFVIFLINAQLKEGTTGKQEKNWRDPVQTRPCKMNVVSLP